MTASMTRRKRRARSAGRRAAGSPVLHALARTGLAVRGLLYVIIGVLAIRIAVGRPRQQADQDGALRTLAGTSLGSVLLWLVVAGFAGLALWQLAGAIYGLPGANGRKPVKRLAALGRALLYVVSAYVTLKYALGAGAPQSGNQQPVDLTAAALRHPGGQLLVIIIGAALTAGGGWLAWRAWRRDFLDDLQTGRMRARTRRTVERLGLAGETARGIIFVTVGIFLITAAVRSQPSQAKGIDSALRVLAATPAGPWLLAVVAIGLVMFGLYSCCQARWLRT
jgi:hypothetical protein